MNVQKIVVRFLEAHPANEVDAFLVSLFNEWMQAAKPSVSMEKQIYLNLVEVREFLRTLTLYVENGASQDLGFFLLIQKFFKDQPISIRDAVVRKLYADWLKATKPGKHFRKETFEVATSIRVLLNELNQSSSKQEIS